MSLLQRLGILAATGIAALGLSGIPAKAGLITIINDTSNLDIGVNELKLKNVSGASEAYNTSPLGSHDVDFLTYPGTALEGYTNVGGHKLSTDSRPINTSGWDINLGVNGTVTTDNTLRVWVDDSTNISNARIYNKANPGIKYTLPLNGSEYDLNLPGLVNQSGLYGTWRVDINISEGNNAVPEPGAAGLYGSALLAGLGIRALGGRREK